MDDCDEDARKTAEKSVYMRDGFMLALRVLSFMARHALTPAEALASVPRSSSEERFIRLNCPPQRVLDRLRAVPEENEGAVIPSGGNRLLLRPDKRGTGLFMYAESFGSETASSLCDSAEKLIRDAAAALKSAGDRQ